MRWLFRWVAALIVAAMAVAGAAGYLVWTRLQAPFAGGFGGEQFVQVPPGSGTADIGRRLVRAGVVSDPWTFRAALWWTGRARTLKAGEYRFVAPASPLDVVDRLARGDVYQLRITFPEGLTIDEMAGVFEARGFGPAAAFREAAGNAALVTDLDPAARDLEGYLFPETYSVPRGVPAAALVEMMVARFRLVYAAASAGGSIGQVLTTRQVVTLASLVEEETAQPEERPMVSAVYRNRLRIGMGMQADPTVVYALRKAGKYNGNIRRDDLRIDSPYNTYRYGGLPPGPIAAPGQASLEAALRPAAVPYLYFVSRNDGSHVFAETLRQHNANVNQYQVLFFRKAARPARRR